MNIIETNIIYENPLPQLRSRQSFFPSLCQRQDGVLAAVFAMGEAFESVDSTSYISFSDDGGKNWTAPQKMFSGCGGALTDYCKATALPDGRMIAMGYAYYRDDPEKPIGNPKTGGLLDDFVFYAISEDGGSTWGPMYPIPCAWGPHVEAFAPLTVLQNGDWITPVTGFPDWEGNHHGKVCGRALRSRDQGKTWDDTAVCMDFGDKQITCYEQRMCQLASGAVVCIGWNEDMTTGQRLENHYTVSYDNGQTWAKPRSTGILGQASSVCALGGEKLLALHAVRRDTDRPGIYGYVVDFSDGNWNVVDSALVWEPETIPVKDTKMAEIFSYLKFGQPGAIRLADGDILMSHWFAREGQYKTAATRIRL